MKYKRLTAAVLLLALTACSAQNKADKEIKLPIYENQVKVKTVAAAKTDLEESITTAAGLGYAMADYLRCITGGNLITYNAKTYKEFKKGEVIAVFDSSSLDYDYRRQNILTQAAYDTYAQQKTEKSRLEYEYQKSLLDEIEYQKDQYTIYAPYDCIISSAARLTVGEELSAGDFVCTVAPVDEIYVYIGYDPEKTSDSTPFHLGGKVNVKLTGKTYEATVVSVPKSTNYKFPFQYESQQLSSNTQYEPQSLGLAPEKISSDSFSNKGYTVLNTLIGDRPEGGSPTADSSKNIFIKFSPEVLQQVLEETPNAVSAGWATVTVVTKSLKNVLALPKDAVTSRGGSYVYLYKDGQRIQTPVLTGETINGYTVILAGLSEGDTVAVNK